ncbi:HET-domain-containing protein, partial [Cadophora sp. DSE1049]
MRWLSECLKTHSKCAPWASTPKQRNPSRLLDIESSVDIIKLCCPDPGPVLEYATLSHRWEADNLLRLLTTNIELFMEGIPMDILSDTFRDAVCACRQLNVRYLWIDSLCILQDSKCDWTEESSRMGEVYRNCHFCLAAIAASDGDKALYTKRDPLIVKPLFRRTTETWYDGDTAFEADLYRIHLGSVDTKEIDDSNLQTRGWVFQERALAPRTLYIGASELFWGCHGTFASEKWPRGMPTRKGLDIRLRNAVLMANENLGSKVWAEMLRIYTSTKLTEEEDRLVAFSGIAKLFEDQSSGHYLAGLWSKHLHHELLWSCNDDDKQVTRSEAYVAPTWSWACLQSG